MTTVGFYTLGCKVNQQETSALAARFQAAGFVEVPFSAHAAAYVINSCAVTGEAERKSLSLARRQKQRHPESVVVLAGCFPQVSLAKATSAGVDLLVGSNDKASIVELVTERMQGQSTPAAVVTPWSGKTAFEVISDAYSSSRARATLKVQDGCEQYCTYCIIPYARGRERSLNLETALAQAQSLAAQGFKEIILSGIHLGAYGCDLTPPLSLARLVGVVTATDGLRRLRLGSVEPNDVTGALLAQFAQNPKLCPHVHLPLQSGSNSVLRRMQRRYTAEEYVDIVQNLREAACGIAITTDVLVGFPGESEAEFRETCELVSRIGFSRLHIFRYSLRNGTPAAQMQPHVPAGVKTARAKALQALAEREAYRFNSTLVGKDVEVLVESEEGDSCVGHTANYVKAYLPSTHRAIGDVVTARVVSATADGVWVSPGE